MIKVALLLATALFENHRCKTFSSICHFALLVSSRSTSQHMLLVAMKPWMFKALDGLLRRHIAGIKLVLCGGETDDNEEWKLFKCMYLQLTIK